MDQTPTTQPEPLEPVAVPTSTPVPETVAAPLPNPAPVVAPVESPTPVVEPAPVVVAPVAPAAPLTPVAAPTTLEQAVPSAVVAQPQPVDPALDAEMLDSGAAEESSFVWEASEYIHHEKGGKWYIVFGLVFLALLAVLVYIHQWLGVGLFVVMAAAVVIYARKPPRTLTYELTHDAISIDGHPYLFSQFRSFAVLKDIGWHTIDLEPTQRFMPRTAILFEDESYDSIVDHLSQHLPRVEREPDAVERLTRYLRF